MSTLGEIPEIRDNIKSASVNAVKALHKIVFEEDAGRQNRGNLRKFPGFNFGVDSDEFKDKVAYVEQNIPLADLIAACNVIKLDYSGEKPTLIRRICMALSNLENLIAENEADDADEDEQSDLEDEVEEEDQQAPVAAPQRFILSFRDVEDSLRTFDGKSSYPVERWIQDFEETALLFGWDDLQKLIFAKKSLRGLAKIYVQSETNISTWGKLKKKLKSEFGKKINSAKLHQILRERSLRKDEDVHEYFLSMRELASRGNVEVEALIQYIIDGINDSLTNKVVLYGASTLHEFKKKLEIYETIRTKTTPPVTKVNRSVMPTGQRSTSAEGNKSSPRKCYNCNLSGHIAAHCPRPRREKGSCYKCGILGHFSNKCPSKPEVGRSTTFTNTERPGPSTLLIEEVAPADCSIAVKLDPWICPWELNGVLDSGSPISLIKDSFVPVIFRKAYSSCISYSGINSSVVDILGLYEGTVHFNSIQLSTLFHIVSPETMRADLVLGRNFLFQPNLEVKFNNQQVILNKISDEPPLIKPSGSNELLLIDPDIFKTPDENFIVNPDVDPVINFKLHDILNQHIVAKEPDIPAIDFEAQIIVKSEHTPFHFQPRRLSFFERDKLQVILDDLLKQGIIRESNSPYASPIVLVKKKSGELRLCLDFRELNKLVVRDRYPLPLIDDQLDSLKNKRFFTKLDLQSAFHHVKLTDDSTKYTAFVTPMGQYEYLRMPFGFCNSPSIFMRYINKIFRSLLSQNKISIFLDDILIATESIEDNIDILQEVLALVKLNKLKLRLDKCCFLMTTINYLGYQVSAEGISPCNEHIESVFRFPTPKNHKDVQSFLGLVSYFRRFVRSFSEIAKPLTDLTRKNVAFNFGQAELESFERLKNSLVSCPLLAIYSPTAETELHCDASSLGYGAILLQKQHDQKFHPIAFFSKRATTPESKYHSFELECLSIIYALKRFHTYLHGIKFKIVTDCDSLRLTLSKKDLNPRIARWALWLQNYDYTVEHRNSDRMKHVDALSRNHILILEDNTLETTLSLQQMQDGNIIKIRNLLEEREHKKFELRNGLVYFKGSNKLLFYVPQAMEYQVIRMYHDEFGHVGRDKVVELITRFYWFPKLRDKVKNYISHCLKCIAYSPNSGKKEGYLHSIPKGNIPFDTIHIDHYGPLEKTPRGYKYIFEVEDGFTKFVKLYPCKTTNVNEVIKHLNHYFDCYSKPMRVVSDRGSCFTSVSLADFFQINSVEHIQIASGAPRANGQMERCNRDITPILAKITPSLNKWDTKLPDVEFAINNTVNRSTKETPSKLLFGRNQRGPVDDALSHFLSNEFDVRSDINMLRANASQNIQVSQSYNKELYDKKRKPARRYKVHDFVMISNTDVTPGVNKKLIPKFRGPYVISAVLPHDRYFITDIEGFQHTQIPFKGVYDSSRMKPWLGSDVNSSCSLDTQET